MCIYILTVNLHIYHLLSRISIKVEAKYVQKGSLFFSMRAKENGQSRFLRLITLPIRALGKARDFYVRSMTDYAGKLTHGNYASGPTAGQLSSLPKSFSVSSSRSNENDDFRELIRAASTRSTLGNRVDVNDMELYMQQHGQVRRPAADAVPRSRSVAMGRIDEEKSCDFGEESLGVAGRAELIFPRSRSHAVAKRNTVF
ncbi:uncharacterized protein LOC127798903 [Diospyros lotus]|uniref:uncharacterized protein LOC127798903 n=1 Tax=Diospyros lotus TaxID=55363 RepID=UPI0022561592|nr:uncharacterized protein LOC127798903 [Diospyros lotus]